jgi:hypothetical protein
VRHLAPGVEAATHPTVETRPSTGLQAQLEGLVRRARDWPTSAAPSYTLEKTTAANDIGILSWPDGHAVAVTAFLTASTASAGERDALLAELARGGRRATPGRGRRYRPECPGSS